ncbi:MAG: hypothetical protein HN948_04820 [Clostridia bacterium]|nr:hypothetical protein [Clostridia bacterium]MBT7122313.1 hypothetical protein [Clostridia bacterium]
MKGFRELSSKMKLIAMLSIIVTIILFIFALLNSFSVGIFSAIGDWIKIAGYANFLILGTILAIVNTRRRKRGRKAVNEEDGTL